MVIAVKVYTLLKTIRVYLTYLLKLQITLFLFDFKLSDTCLNFNR